MVDGPNVSQIQRSGDMYIMDGQSFDMETLMMTLQVQRSNTIEAQMIDQAEIIKQNNAKLKALADVLAELRRNRPSDADGTYNDNTSAAAKCIADQLRDKNNSLHWEGMGNNFHNADFDAVFEQACKNAGVEIQKLSTGGYYVPPDQEAAVQAALDEMSKTAGGITPEMQAVIDEFGIKMPGDGSKQSDFDAAIDQVKGAQDSLNSQSQLDMIRLQSCQNKLNQAYEMMTNFVSKFAKTKDTIIGNMR